MFFIIGLLKTYAFYGFVSLLVCLIGLRINISEMIRVIGDFSTFKTLFYNYMLLSLPAYAVLSIIHFCIGWINDNFIEVIPEDWRAPYFDGALGRLEVTITNPIRGLFAFVGAKDEIDSFDLYGIYCWFQVIIHFVSMVFLIGFIGYGFYTLMK